MDIGAFVGKLVVESLTALPDEARARAAIRISTKGGLHGVVTIEFTAGDSAVGLGYEVSQEILDVAPEREIIDHIGRFVRSLERSWGKSAKRG